MRPVTLVLLALLTTVGCGPPRTAPDEVARVVDGDTIIVGDTTVRLIGIDTPETRDPRRSVQCFGREASRRTSEFLPRGTRVRLEYDVERTDRYGRALAYVYREPDGLFVNWALVAEGYATVLTYPPNDEHADEFLAAEREARGAARGLWASCPHDGSDLPNG